MFGLELVGKPRPIAPKALAAFSELPPTYEQLLTTWGPGRAFGLVEFPDPTEPEGTFVALQARYRLHAPHLRATGRWTRMSGDDVERGIVVGHRMDGALLVSTRTLIAVLELDGSSSYPRELQDVLRNERWTAEQHKLRATYSVEPAPRHELFAALERGDEQEADRLLALIFEREAAWTVLEIAHELALASGTITPALRSTYFAQCLRLAKRSEAERLHELPVRAISDELADGPLSAEHAALFRTIAYPPGSFSRPIDARERDLLVQAPHDRVALVVLADHLEERGDAVRAALVREQAEAMSLDEAVARGLVVDGEQVDSTELFATWRAAWADDPASDISSLVASAEALQPQHRHAIIAWIHNRTFDKLAVEPAAFPLLVLALRSASAGTSLHLFGEAKTLAAGPWILRVIRNRTVIQYRYGNYVEPYQFAQTHCDIGAKLTAAELTEVLGWFDSERRASAVRLLQRYGKDDRVFLAALEHFADGHPFTERTIARRKTDPRVIPALLAAFDRAEDRSIADGRHVVYTSAYKILSRYLAKLGDARGKAAWERCKKMDRVNQATADRAARREGI